MGANLKQHAKKFLDQYPPASSCRVNYGYTLSEFFRFLNTRQIKNISMLRIEQFLLSPTHKKTRPSNAYFNFRLSTLRTFYNYLAKHKLIKTNPTQFIRSKNTPQTHSERTLTTQEVRYILRHTTGVAHIAILVMVNTGLRLAELCSLRRQNLKTIQLDQGPLTYIQVLGKGQKPRNLNVNPKVIAAIKQQLNKNKHLANTPLFPGLKPGTTITPRSLYRIIKKQLKTIGFPNTTPHWFRHTFAQLLSQNKDLQTTQAALGHSNLNTTQRYIQKLKVVNIQQNLIDLD